MTNRPDGVFAPNACKLRAMRVYYVLCGARFVLALIFYHNFI